MTTPRRPQGVSAAIVGEREGEARVPARIHASGTKPVRPQHGKHAASLHRSWHALCVCVCAPRGLEAVSSTACGASCGYAGPVTPARRKATRTPHTLMAAQPAQPASASPSRAQPPLSATCPSLTGGGLNPGGEKALPRLGQQADTSRSGLTEVPRPVGPGHVAAELRR